MFASGLHVLVIGAGPAGLALANACAALGMRVGCVAPRPHAPWARSFAVWQSEIAAFGEHAHIEATWPAPPVWLADNEQVALAEPYVRLSAPALQASLLASASRAGVALYDSEVSAVTHDVRSSTASLCGGGSVQARVVVDASGPGSPFVARPGRRAPAHQIAYGELVETREPVAMALMDYRGTAHDPPSFLYALPLGDGRVFLEETVLATRQPVALAELRARLHARLARVGVSVSPPLERERCVIPLGVELPLRGQRIVAFGAAAGMVHPATGYQLARAIAAAPVVARALAADLEPSELSARAHAACWPASRTRAWALYTFGMEALASFDHEATSSFLRAFFTLPPATALAFLRGELSPAGIALAMGRVLLHAKAPMKKRLARLLLDQHETFTRPPEEIA